jgi:hypothetical protein
MFRRHVIALGAIALTAGAAAQESTPTREQATDMANALARCAGIYEGASQMMREAGQVASAQELHEQYNGAAVAAQYVLSADYNGRNPDKPQRTLGEFAEYVSSVAGAAITSFHSWMEQDDHKRVGSEMETCIALQEAQKVLIQAMRDAAAGR